MILWFYLMASSVYSITFSVKHGNGEKKHLPMVMSGCDQWAVIRKSWSESDAWAIHSFHSCTRILCMCTCLDRYHTHTHKHLYIYIHICSTHVYISRILRMHTMMYPPEASDRWRNSSALTWWPSWLAATAPIQPVFGFNWWILMEIREHNTSPIHSDACAYA